MEAEARSIAGGETMSAARLQVNLPTGSANTDRRSAMERTTPKCATPAHTNPASARAILASIALACLLLASGCVMPSEATWVSPRRPCTQEELGRRNPFRLLGEIESVRLFGAPDPKCPSFFYPKQKHRVVSLTSTILEVPFWALTWVGVRRVLCPVEHEKEMRRARQYAQDEGQAEAFVAGGALIIMAAGCVGSWAVDVVTHDIPVMLFGWPTEAIIKWKTGKPYPPLPTD